MGDLTEQDEPLKQVEFSHRQALDDPDWAREGMAAAIPRGQVVLLTVEHDADGSCCRIQSAMLTLGIEEVDDPQPDLTPAQERQLAPVLWATRAHHQPNSVIHCIRSDRRPML